MKILLFTIALMIMFAMTACSVTRAGHGIRRISVQNAAAPNNMDNGEPVQMYGYLRVGFEDINLYSSRNAAREHTRGKCVAVDLSDVPQSTILQYSNKFVVIRGRWVTDICPKGAICQSSCTDDGVLVKHIYPAKER